MNRLLTTLVGLAFFMQMTANPVTAIQAREKATKFLNARVAGKMKSVKRSQSSLETALVGGEDSYYVFNVGQDEGFVIVSGEDITNDILGYSDEGHFDVETLPDEVKSWMQGYADEISWLRQNELQLVRKSISSPYDDITLDESKLAYWNQDYPFRNMCPKEDGLNTAVGCVPLAMAQMLYYHKRPLKTFCEIPSHVEGIDAVPAGTVIDWGNMDALPENIVKPEQKDAVANLALYCGLAVTADYGLKGTGADGHSIVYAMAKYFGYNPSMEYLDRNNYSYEDWTLLINTELGKGRPVFYGGQSSSGGHRFLLYGYKNGLYYINWGWGKDYNGYYRLSVTDFFSPIGDDYGGISKYNHNQGAIVEAYPTDGSKTYIPRLTAIGMDSFDDLTLTRQQSATSFPAFDVTFKVENYNPVSLEFETGCALFQNGVQVGDAFWTGTTSLFAKHSFLNRAYTIQISSDIPDGTYRLMPVCRENGQTEAIADYASSHYYVEVTVQGTRLTTKCHNSGGVLLNAKKFALSEGIVQKPGLALAFDCELENTSTQAYTGDIMICMDSSKGKDSVLVATQITVEPNKVKELELEYVPHQEGTYQVRLVDKNGNRLATETVNVEHAQNLKVMSYQFDNYNVANKTIEGSVLKGKVTLRNNDTEPFQENFTVMLFCSDTQSGSGYSIHADLQGETSGVYEFQFSNLRVGNVYHLEFSYPDTQCFGTTGWFTCIEPNNDGLKVGDVFTAKTVEGVNVMYKVTSLSPKTVAVSSESGEMWATAVAEETSGSVTIPEIVNGYQVTAIAPYAFCYTGITSVTIPISVESIGRGAFFDCEELVTVNGMKHVKDLGGIAFRRCGKLSSLPLPSTLKSIGSQAFGSCSSLTSVTIPASVTLIDANGLFMSCDNLTSIVVEEGNTVYDSRGNCNALIETATNTLLSGCTYTSIPVDITAIAPQALQGFSGLKDVIIPESVREIGGSAFAFCMGLKTVTSLIKEPFAIQESVFNDYYGSTTIYNQATLYVPKGTRSAYAKTDGWKKFSKIVEIGSVPSVKGDVNKDGKVDISDATMVIDLIGKAYSADADVNRDMKVSESDVRLIIKIILQGDAYSDPNAVDLGLSVKWSSMNVGASAPEEYGGYYAWGETAEKNVYTWQNYKFGDATAGSLTKYCLSSSYGTVDGKTVLESMDDAARINAGYVWRIPTKAEMDELVEQCQWTPETLNGVPGYRVTGPSGKSIFMPFGGSKSDDQHYNLGRTGFYWTSGLAGSAAAPALYMYNGSIDYMNYTRDTGRSIRPVLKRADERDDSRLEDIVPEDMREKMKNHMPIYNGINPPIIEGSYLLKPYTTVYCEDGNYKPGQVIDTYKIKFSNQDIDVNTIDMDKYDTQGDDYSSGKGAFISGDGSNFTAFFSTEGYSQQIYNRTALIISGTKDGDAIRNLYYGFVMVEKGDDPKKKLMDVGVFRIFKDGDNVSQSTSWDRASSSRETQPETSYKSHTAIDGPGAE